MNIKLEVIRMTNEDVIATSGVCQHPNSWHVKITANAGGNYTGTTYFPQGETYFQGSSIPSQYFIDGTENINVGDFYYSDQDYNLHYCDGDHDFSSYNPRQ